MAHPHQATLIDKYSTVQHSTEKRLRWLGDMSPSLSVCTAQPLILSQSLTHQALLFGLHQLGHADGALRDLQGRGGEALQAALEVRVAPAQLDDGVARHSWCGVVWCGERGTRK